MDTIAILDFGGQYAHLIANRVRRLGVYSEIVDGEISATQLKNYKGLILSGGPNSVYEEGSLKCDPGILDLGIPILGICYGHQLLAYTQGVEVSPEGVKEYGLAELTIQKTEGIFKDLGPKETVWMSHGDTVMGLPQGYEVIGLTSEGGHAAIADLHRNFYGVQFHLEVTHTISGQKMLENFLDICGCKKEWKIDDYIEKGISAIQKQVGTKKVFMMVSGGVDSTVAFALLEKALGSDRVYGLFVDTGFLRMNEKEEASEALKKVGFNHLHIQDASDAFFEALKGIYEPEAKRKIIGDMFLKVQGNVVRDLKLDPENWLLGQGTIYPDTIETGGTKHAAKIKTHHNRVPQIEELIKQGRVIEPLSQLYKDEVRQLGEKLGLPEKMLWRHPFPGPGLAVRTLCAEKESWPLEKDLLEKRINEIVSDHGLQAHILPIQSVGVQGDFRTYRHPVVLSGKADFALLDKLATQLINQFQDINRVLWLVSPEEIQTLQVHPNYLTRERNELLQQADAKVTDFIYQNDLNRAIWQFPTVLLPLSVNTEVGESIVLRPVSSEEAMTANFYPMDQDLLQKLQADLKTVKNISAIFYDVTNKPPGTIEWE